MIFSNARSTPADISHRLPIAGHRAANRTVLRDTWPGRQTTPSHPACIRDAGLRKTTPSACPDRISPPFNCESKRIQVYSAARQRGAPIFLYLFPASRFLLS